jgi:hypothetical protein
MDGHTSEHLAVLGSHRDWPSEFQARPPARVETLDRAGVARSPGDRDGMRQRNEPPERERPGPTPGTGPNHKALTITTADTDEPTAIARQLRHRRGASYRLPVLESGRADPWWYEPASSSYEAAATYLLECGLTPAPNREGLQAMRRRGGHHRQSAKLIAERWDLAS